TMLVCFFFSSRRRHTRLVSDWSSDVCSSDLWFAFITFQWGGDNVRARSAASLGAPGSSNQNVQPRPGSDSTPTLPPCAATSRLRSEERRVGKEGRSRGAPHTCTKRGRSEA